MEGMIGDSNLGRLEMVDAGSTIAMLRLFCLRFEIFDTFSYLTLSTAVIYSKLLTPGTVLKVDVCMSLSS